MTIAWPKQMRGIRSWATAGCALTVVVANRFRLGCSGGVGRTGSVTGPSTKSLENDTACHRSPSPLHHCPKRSVPLVRVSTRPPRTSDAHAVFGGVAVIGCHSWSPLVCGVL